MPHFLIFDPCRFGAGLFLLPFFITAKDSVLNFVIIKTAPICGAKGDDHHAEYDPTEEFGIDRDAYSQMKESVNGFFESMISRNDDSDYEYSEYSDSDESVEEPEYVDLLNNPDYEIVYEKHGWSFVKEFFSEFSTLDEGQDYAMLFLLSQNKSNHKAFVNTALGMLLSCNPKDPDNKRSLSCNVSDSSDGQNHFWLLKRK